MDHDPPRKPDSGTCERKALSERGSYMCNYQMRAEALHKLHMDQSVRAVAASDITSQCAETDRD